jgi:hypothetical protein
VTLTCPVCQASNDAGPTCRRCRADLSLCVAVELQRKRELSAARSAASTGRVDEAFDHIDRVAALRRALDGDRLRAVVCLLTGDFTAAWNAYRHIMTPP